MSNPGKEELGQCVVQEQKLQRKLSIYMNISKLDLAEKNGAIPME